MFIIPSQDSNPAGTIFAEDIADVAPDEYESKKDSKVGLLFEGARSSQSTVALSFSPQHGFVFKILTRGRDYILNAPNQQKRVNSYQPYYKYWVQFLKVCNFFTIRMSGSVEYDLCCRPIENKVYIIL